MSKGEERGGKERETGETGRRREGVLGERREITYTHMHAQLPDAENGEIGRQIDKRYTERHTERGGERGRRQRE